jgi:hypothetical protein
MTSVRRQGIQFMSAYILVLLLYVYFNFGNGDEVNIFLSQNITRKMKVKYRVPYGHIIWECTKGMQPPTR